MVKQTDYRVKSCGKRHASCRVCKPLQYGKVIPSEKRAPWVNQSYREWRRWRFAQPFLDLEEEIGPETLWGTMVKVCWGGVEPRTAAKIIVLAHAGKEPAETHPLDRKAARAA